MDGGGAGVLSFVPDVSTTVYRGLVVPVSLFFLFLLLFLYQSQRNLFPLSL